MLKDRVISSLIWITYIGLVIFIFPSWVFLATVVAIIGLGLYEFFMMVEKKGVMVYKYFGIIVGCLIPITVYMQFKPTAETEFMLITAVCLAVFILQFARRKTDQALFGIATTVFGIFYISWLFSFIIKLRVAAPGGVDGRFLVLYLLIVTKSGDVAAYLVGTPLGRHHLIPRISPKKTIEGTIAGFITSLIFSIALKGFLPPLNIFYVAILGITLGVISQVGDLSESLIKRDCQIKDSSSLFPGLGGILDLIDSLLFTTPILYFYLRFIQ